MERSLFPADSPATVTVSIKQTCHSVKVTFLFDGVLLTAVSSPGSAPLDSLEEISPVVLDQRAASGRGPFRPATARGWGCTGQGLSVLHGAGAFVECTHVSPSGTRLSCKYQWSTARKAIARDTSVRATCRCNPWCPKG